jgi:hypothetical protein
MYNVDKKKSTLIYNQFTQFEGILELKFEGILELKFEGILEFKFEGILKL